MNTEKERVLKELKDRGYSFWPYSLIITESFLEEGIERVKEIVSGNSVDYILIFRNGPVEFYHYTKDIDSLISTKYISSRKVSELSFGPGIYGLKMSKNKSFHKLFHNGIYFVCYIDIHNGLKDGTTNPDFQEILIPIWGISSIELLESGQK